MNGGGIDARIDVVHTSDNHYIHYHALNSVAGGDEAEKVPLKNVLRAPREGHCHVPSMT